MITIKYPLLAREGESEQWGVAEYLHIPGRSLVTYLEVPASQLERVVYEGRAFYGPEIATIHPIDGDEIHIVPRMSGKNAGLYLAVAGAIIGGLYAGAPGVQAGLQIGMALGAFYAYFNPGRSNKKSGDGNASSYFWNGITNDSRAGSAEPVAFGEGRTGGIRASGFISFRSVANSQTGGTELQSMFNKLIYVSKAPHGFEAIFDVRLNEQPIANFNVKNPKTPGAPTDPPVHYYYTLGESPEQWYDSNDKPCPRPQGYDSVKTTYAQSFDLTPPAGIGTITPFVYTTTPDFGVDAIECILQFPSGLAHQTERAISDENSVAYTVEYRLFGASAWINCQDTGFTLFGDPAVARKVITAHRRTPFIDTFRISNLTRGRYDVRISWTNTTGTGKTAARDEALDAFHLVVTGVTEEQNTLKLYPGKAMLAVQSVAISNLNGTEPTVSCGYRGIKVPWRSGGVWQAPTWWGPDHDKPIGRSPAWTVLTCFRDRANVPFSGYQPYGAGDDIPDTDIYLPSWEAFAASCAETVTVTRPDLTTYTEPRHLIDGVLNQQRKWKDGVEEMLASFRAKPMMGGNGSQWSVFYDGPTTPSQMFTMGNIKAGSFAIDFGLEDTSVNAFQVTMPDRNRDYQNASFTVVSKLKDPSDPIRSQPLQFQWITRISEGARQARFELNASALIDVACDFAASTDALLVRHGQVARVQHDIPQWGFGGRVLAGTTTVVTTKLPATKTSGVVTVHSPGTGYVLDFAHNTYNVAVRFADGSAEAGQERTIASADVNANGLLTLTVTAPFSIAPTYQDLIFFGLVGARDFRVVSITRDGDSQRRLANIEYNPSLYDDTVDPVVVTYTELPDFGNFPGAITAATATEDLSQRNDRSKPSSVIFAWTPPQQTPGFGFYLGATIELSYDGVAFDALDSKIGTTYTWQNAPHEKAMWFRFTPYSTSHRFNTNGAYILGPVTFHGYVATLPAVTGFAASVADNSFLWRWTDLGREYQYEGRAVNADWGVNDGNLFFRGRTTEFRLTAPPSRSVGIYIRAFDAFGNYSATSVLATASDTAPGAPSITSVNPSKTGFTVKVTPPADADVLAIHLHASHANGFTPSAANRVAAMVGPQGGEFAFAQPAGDTNALWYFLATAEDWLSDRLGGWVYSVQASSSIVVIAPVLPSGLTFTENPTSQKRRIATSTPGQPPTMTHVFSLFLNWSHVDTVNPAATLIGFYAVIYPAGGSPNVPYLSATLTPAARSWGIDGITFESLVSWVGAVQAIYVDGYTSAFVTSSGLTLNPGTGEDVLAQLLTDANGGYYLNRTVKITDASGAVVTIDKNGIATTSADGILRAPRRAMHALLRAANNSQFVNFTDPNLDPPLALNTSGLRASKLHVVAQLRNGAALGLLPQYYPTHIQCDAVEVQDYGFRVVLNQADGGVVTVARDTAPSTSGWSASAVHGSSMLITSTPDPVDTLGRAAWYDPVTATATWASTLRHVLWLAADMPTVPKADGTPFYVDITFLVGRFHSSTGTPALNWNGTYASLPSTGAPYSLWGPLTLRAYTNGKRWRMPWVASMMGSPFGAYCYVVFWTTVAYETGTTSGTSAPVRVIMDAFDSHGLVAANANFRGNIGPQDVDLLFIEDN